MKMISLIIIVIIGYIIYGMLHRGPLGEIGALALALLFGLWGVKRVFKV